jgi:hypothetical protein
VKLKPTEHAEITKRIAETQPTENVDNAWRLTASFRSMGGDSGDRVWCTVYERELPHGTLVMTQIRDRGTGYGSGISVSTVFVPTPSTTEGPFR